MAELANRQALRLFLALWPPEPVRQALVALQHDWEWPDRAALVASERLHVTLHFLGAVPPDRVPRLQQALDVAFEPHAMRLDAGRCRVWPGGVAVLELQPPPELLRLQASLGEALQRFGWPVEERRFRPHVTFARRAVGARPPATIPAFEWRAECGYSLVRSAIGRGYETLHSYRAAPACNRS